MLQFVNKETQSLLLTFNRFQILFSVSVVDFEWGFFCWVSFFNDSKNSNGYSIPSPANKYMLKVLEITEDNSNENIFKKQPPDVLYKKSVHKYLAKFIGKDLCQCFFFNKVANVSPATLLKRESYKVIFLWILQNF